jgi:PAS domain S-box-containing protein
MLQTSDALIRDPSRLSALRRLALLDTPPEEAFDRLTRLAARLLAAPIALFALVAEDRVFFKSAFGLPGELAAERGVPVANAVCASTLGAPGPVLISDLGADPATAGSPFARYGARSYAGVPLVTSDGHPVGTFCVIDTRPRRWTSDDVDALRDLGASTLTEVELRAAEARFRTLVEQLPLVTYADSLELEQGLYASPQIAELTGWSHEEWTASYPHRFFESLHADDRERIEAATRAWYRRPGPWRHEYRLVRPDGGVRWVLDEAVIVSGPDGRPSHSQGYMLDITERKRVEEALRRSEQRFRAIFDSAAFGIAVVDAEGRLIESNRAYRQLTGYRGSELKALPFSSYTHPEDADRALALFRDLRDGEIDRFETEVRYVRKDERVVWAHVSAARLQDADGRPLVITVAEDVTSRRELEQQFRQAQKMEAVGRLAGGIAHDFNNLLTAITGYAEIMLAKLPGSDPLRRDAEEIRKAGDRAASLTRQLLAFSRRQMLRPRVLDLNAVVAETESMLRRLIGEDIELVTDLARGLGHVRTDPGQMAQVLVNLAVNARDAMPDGGELRIETADADVGLGFARRHPPMQPGSYVRLSLIDTGVGMDAEILSHVFEPFFTTKEQGAGTGLGLSTVYGIVKQSGGFVWVSSEPGHGTRFDVYLPRVDAELELDPAPPEASPLFGTETILLVEDEDVVRELVCEILESNGYTVLEARDGEAALDIFRGHEGPIDLLLTDVVMPRMGGRDLAERVTAQRPDVRVLFMSGYASSAVGSLAPGAAFVQKPFSTAALAERVREVLDGGGRLTRAA